MQNDLNSPVTLVSVAGPRVIRHVLTPPGPITLGRRDNNTIVLMESDKISRQHARLIHQPGAPGTAWFLVDNRSRHGTRLNGVSLVEGKPYPVSNDDLIEISPWTFRIRDPAVRRDGDTLRPQDIELDSSMVSEITAALGNEYAQRQLDLLLKCAESFHAAATAQALAEALADAAIAGTGFTNVAVLRPLEADGSVEMLAARGADLVGASRGTVSRTLLTRASAGLPVRLSRKRESTEIVHSIVQMAIDEAICIPIMLGSAPAGYLYLDCRQNRAPGSVMAASAVDFALGLGRLAALSLASLARNELAHRIAGVESEMKAARRAQVAILPAAAGRFGSLAYKGENRPGRLVSGDFYDVIPLSDGRLAVTLGDVVGKGMAAAVLMTLAQGFLHSSLRQHADLAKAFGDLNAYLHQRYGREIFLTLWAAIIDPQRGLMHYADAGHGYAFHLPAGHGAVEALREGGGPPIGVQPQWQNQAVEKTFVRGDRLLLISDGIVEQPATVEDALRTGEYGSQRMETLVSSLAPSDDVIDAIFRDVVRHAGTANLADDTTALIISAG